MGIFSMIYLFLNFGFFTLFLGMVNEVCTEKIEKIKKDKKVLVKKVNYCLFLVYLLIGFAIYWLLCFRVLLITLFSVGIVSIYFIQLIRPDLFCFFDKFNKNVFLRFLCKLLISVQLFLKIFYAPIFKIIKTGFYPMFLKYTNDFDSDMLNFSDMKMPDFKNLNKTNLVSMLSDQFSGLQDYLCSDENLEEINTEEINNQEVNNTEEINIQEVINQEEVNQEEVNQEVEIR